MMRTGTCLRKAAAASEVAARLTAAVLAKHIDGVPVEMRHHYLNSAPLPPEAEECEKRHYDADDQGDVCTAMRGHGKRVGFLGALFGRLRHSACKLGFGGVQSGAGSVAANDCMQPVGGVAAAQGFPVFAHADDAASMTGKSNPAIMAEAAAASKCLRGAGYQGALTVLEAAMLLCLRGVLPTLDSCERDTRERANRYTLGGVAANKGLLKAADEFRARADACRLVIALAEGNTQPEGAAAMAAVGA